MSTEIKGKHCTRDKFKNLQGHTMEININTTTTTTVASLGLVRKYSISYIFCRKKD